MLSAAVVIDALGVKLLHVTVSAAGITSTAETENRKYLMPTKSCIDIDIIQSSICKKCTIC